MPTFHTQTHELTTLLHAWRAGDRKAEEILWVRIYNELRRLARYMRRERGPVSRAAAGTTTVVHEAYLRLAGSEELVFEDRRHFFAIAARAMRFVLVDSARRRQALKRAAETTGEIPEEIADPQAQPPEELLAVHEALAQLAEINPRQEKLVELHYFAGLTLDEAAEILEVSRRTVMREWKSARVWLHGELAEARNASSRSEALQGG